jgi:hypothetical protein
MSEKICIVSGGIPHRLRSDINHRMYAARHSHDYLHDTGPYQALQNIYFFKLHSVEKALPHYDWVFWIDDDAFFTDFEKDLAGFIQDISPDVFLVICKSPVNPQGWSTFLNSGVFFVKNCEASFAFLDAAKAVPLEKVKPWWDEARLGPYTGTDQDAVTYTLHENHLLSKVRLLDYGAFNNRPYHYQARANEHFIVHFPGVPDKHAAIDEFSRRYDLQNGTLIPNRVTPQS